mgnify:CR=1 FL=1
MCPSSRLETALKKKRSTKITIAGSGAVLKAGCFDGMLSTITDLEILGAATIERNCLYENTSIKTLTLGSNISTIAPGAFTDTKLTTINYNISNLTYSAGSGPIFVSNTSDFSIVFGNNVTVIPNYLCSNCSTLTSIKFPTGLTTIGNNAFYNCSSLFPIM